MGGEGEREERGELRFFQLFRHLHHGMIEFVASTGRLMYLRGE